jgi:hypothetical protein
MNHLPMARSFYCSDQWRLGMLSGEDGQRIMAPFSIDLFKGMLAFFLLDMGLMAAKNFSGIKGKPLIVLLYALVAPLVHAGIALAPLHTIEIAIGGYDPINGACRKCFVYCSAGGIAPCSARSQSSALYGNVLGHHLPLQHHYWHTAVFICSSTVAITLYSCFAIATWYSVLIH